MANEIGCTKCKRGMLPEKQEGLNWVRRSCPDCNITNRTEYRPYRHENAGDDPFNSDTGVFTTDANGTHFKSWD